MYFKKTFLKDLKPSSFKIESSGQVFVNTEGQIIVFDQDYNNNVFLESNSVKVTIILNDHIWVGDTHNGQTYIYNKRGLITTLNFVATIPNGKVDSFLTNRYIYPKIYINRDFSDSYYARISINDYSESDLLKGNFASNNISLIVNDEVYISSNKEKIGLFDFNKELIWQNSFIGLSNSDRAVLHSKVLNSHNKLFFVINGNKNKGLYVLKADTGELLKKFEGVCYEIFQDGDYIFSSRFENILCRINSKTLEIEEWDCNALIKFNGFDAIHDHRCVALANKFYFTQTLGDNKAKVGILDWNQKDLIYKHEFEPKNGGVGSIQVNQTRMFIHTQDNTLHIFEEETE